MKHIDIIGGGIAGLSLGIYLQKAGYHATIYEQNPQCGGLCVSWRRGDYLFNGCLHWILGARDGISFYHFWKEIIDIDKVEFHKHAEKTQFELPLTDRHGSHIFHFINDIDSFESYLLDIAPEDAKPIKEWTSKVRFVMQFLDDLPPVKFSPRLIRLVRILPFMRKWGKMSNRDFAKRFSNPFLKMAVENLYDAEMRMTVLVFAQAYAAKGVALYPVGGSSAFVDNLVKAFLQNGGTIRTSCRVDEILVENGRAVGLGLSNAQATKADFVVSASDWHWTVFKALKGRFVSAQMKPLQNPPRDAVFFSYCRLFLGVAMPMDDMPHFERFVIPKLLSPDGTSYSQLEVEVYNFDHSLAPDGKVTMIVNLLTREGDYWIDLRRNNIQEYRLRSTELSNMILANLEQHYGSQWRSAVEVTDMVTPATWHRYTNNLRGSSQGWSPLDDITHRLPVKPSLPGLKNFIMCGHWMEAGGGVPVALYSARKAAEVIKKRLNS